MTPMMITRRRAAGAVLMLMLTWGLGRALSSYALLRDRWPDGTVTMQLQLGSPARPLSDGSSSYGPIAESALGEWNQQISRLQFNVVRDSNAPKGDGNGVNNVFFSNDIYGMEFESTTLAVTTNWLRRNVRTEADVIFNTSSHVGFLWRRPAAWHARTSAAWRCTSSGTCSGSTTPTTTARTSPPS